MAEETFEQKLEISIEDALKSISQVDDKIDEMWKGFNNTILALKSVGLSLDDLNNEKIISLRRNVELVIQTFGGWKKMPEEVSEKLAPLLKQLKDAGEDIEPVASKLHMTMKSVIDGTQEHLKHSLSQFVPSPEFLKLGIWGLLLGSLIGVSGIANEQAAMIRLSWEQTVGLVTSKMRELASSGLDLENKLAIGWGFALSKNEAQKMIAETGLIAGAFKDYIGEVTKTMEMSKALGQSFDYVSERAQSYAMNLMAASKSGAEMVEKAKSYINDYTSSISVMEKVHQDVHMSLTQIYSNVGNLITRLGDLGQSYKSVTYFYSGMLELQKAESGGKGPLGGMTASELTEGTAGILNFFSKGMPVWFQEKLGEQLTSKEATGAEKLVKAQDFMLNIMNNQQMQGDTMIKTGLPVLLNTIQSQLAGRSSAEIRLALESSAYGFSPAAAKVLTELVTVLNTPEKIEEFIKHPEANKEAFEKYKELVKESEPWWERLLKALFTILQELLMAVLNILTGIYHGVAAGLDWLTNDKGSMKYQEYLAGKSFEESGKNFKEMFEAAKQIPGIMGSALPKAPLSREEWDKLYGDKIEKPASKVADSSYVPQPEHPPLKATTKEEQDLRQKLAEAASKGAVSKEVVEHDQGQPLLYNNVQVLPSGDIRITATTVYMIPGASLAQANEVIHKQNLSAGGQRH